MKGWKLDSLWMSLLGLVATVVLGGAVLDIGAGAAHGVARSFADATPEANPGANARAGALACPI
ncbi:MAG: hypothetical protein ACK4V1_06015 [Burkholderiaceae bacterium]